MFSDTHFHFNILPQEEHCSILTSMAERGCFFGLDIGTKCGDLSDRQNLALNAVNLICDKDIQDKVKSFLFFSAGIWPAVDSIKNRKVEMQSLENQIKNALSSENELLKKVCAIGECGLDHHWNPNNADKRNEDDFNDEIFYGEKELFEMQLELAKKNSLPVIVHSRDAFEGTVESIKNVGYDNGIIHCYSYGIDEAREFLSRGWYLAFGGGVTYTKKSKMEQMFELLRYVPDDRILLETDAPYLAPVPFRGSENNPLLIEHTYRFIAEARGIAVEKLCALVDENIKRLFKI